MAKDLSAIENGSMSNLYENIDGLIVAITGPPGVGKSCLIDSILHRLTPNKTVGVLAVDPTSAISGGALLGDRIRMSVLDDEIKSDYIYFRSVATRSSSGSVPSIIRQLACHLLENEFDIVIIETVGAGQSEMRCAAVADRIIVVEGPVRGDLIQAEKAGLIELADIIVVNKCDLDGAEKVVNELSISLNIGGEPPPICKASAHTGEGVEFLVELMLNISPRKSSKRARARERLFMTHENKIVENPLLDDILDRICQEELSIEEGLGKLYE